MDESTIPGMTITHSPGLAAPPEQLSPHTWLIDLGFRHVPGVIGAYLLTTPDRREVALVETGPTSTIGALLAGIRAVGIDPQNITALCVTHIHLDHAGASGTLMTEYCPRATLYVHDFGAPHMIDPSRLMSSAARIYGDLLDSLWGRMHPVPAERVRVLTDGDTIAVAGRTMHVWYTPGHAIHHVVFHDTTSGEVFTGDVAGVAMPGIDYVRPPTPPPDIDLEGWERSFQCLESLTPIPRALYLTHYGPVHRPHAHLVELRRRLNEWAAIVRRGLQEGRTQPEITALLIAQTQPELRALIHTTEDMRRYELAGSYPMCVAGLARYWQKQVG